MLVAAWIVLIFSVLALFGSDMRGWGGIAILLVLISLIVLSSIVIFDDIKTIAELIATIKG